MNARKSLIWWVAYLAYYSGIFWAFAHGAEQAEPGVKVAWMAGAVVAACLGVFVAKKIN